MGRERWPVLDVVRVTAAGLVFAHHLAVIGGFSLTRFAENGGLAVPAFFALSGFLVYRPFLYRDVEPMAHLRRRFSRVLPALFATWLAVELVLRAQLWWFASVGWSLVIELEFYAMLPFIAVLAKGREVRVVGALAVASFVGAQFAPAVPANVAPAFGPASFWCFALGMLVAIVERDRPKLTGRWWLVAGIPLAVLAAWVPGIVWSDPLPALATALIIAGSLELRANLRPLAFAADASYPAYLWHAPLTAYVAGAVQGPVLVLAAVVITSAVSALSVVVIEPAIRRLVRETGHVVLRERRPFVVGGNG